MKKIIYLITFMIVAGALSTFAQNTPVKKLSSEDSRKLSDKIVNQCAQVKEGEMVLILGNPNNMQLLEDIAVEVSKKGANPLISVSTPQLAHRMYTDVPAKYDQNSGDMNRKLLDFVNTIIAVDDQETPGLFADVPPERMVARSNAMESVFAELGKKKIKFVNLGNGLYPSESKATRYGMTNDQLNDLFWKGVNTDYSKLEANGKALKDILASGKTIHITNPNGTDFKADIQNRKIYVQDGVVSEDDLSQGLAAQMVYLPAGEVIVTPVPGTAQGKIVVDNQTYMGKPIEGLTLEFSNGKLTNMNARSGIEPLKAYYDKGGKGKEEFAYFDFGINPDVVVASNSKMVGWMPAGMVTVGTGNNLTLGGENNSDIGLYYFLPGSTVSVDDKVIIDKGQLKLK